MLGVRLIRRNDRQPISGNDLPCGSPAPSASPRSASVQGRGADARTMPATASLPFTISDTLDVKVIPARKTARILITSPGEGRICRGVYRCAG